MPEACVIIRAPAGLDTFGPGQLIAGTDTGVISDMDGGFDVASCSILVRSGSPDISLKSEHPRYTGLFLFGVSPKTAIGGDSEVALTYKGFHNRELGGGRPPAEGNNAKFTWGCQCSFRTWGKGELTGTIGGVNLANQPVNVMEPRQTVKVSWVGSQPVDPDIFDTTSGVGSGSFGPIQRGPYANIDADHRTYNVPHGWVPIDCSSEQAYAGWDVYLNSVTYVGIPEFSAG